MFSIGWFELLLVGLMALMVFGAEDLPKIGRQIGAWLAQGRRLLAVLRRDWEDLIDEDPHAPLVRDKDEERNPVPTQKAYRKAKQKKS